MGLCSSSSLSSKEKGTAGQAKRASALAAEILDKASAQDYDTSLPVFLALKLKNVARHQFLELYEACCDQGKGSLHYLHQALCINKND